MTNRHSPEPTVGSNEARKLATEMFLTAAGPALVKQVAEILGKHGIPVMPLKGVLLQKLVYGEKTFRPISDVDVLVPEARFWDAYRALRAAGFTNERWEIGRWEVTLKNQNGPPLGVDLHRVLSRTARSNLTASGLFERGTPDTGIFGAAVVLPSADDLFAHLLLHATLDWINLGQVHKLRDFRLVGEVLALDTERCANHLQKQGLNVHALVMLPVIRETEDAPFLDSLARKIKAAPRARLAASLVQVLCSHFPVGHPARRLAGLAPAPSLSRAIISAVWDRMGSERN